MKTTVSRPRADVGARCDDCRHATPDTKFHNLDLHGVPILLRCPFEQYAIVRGSKACKDNYSPKN